MTATTKKNKTWKCDTAFFKECQAATTIRQANAKIKELAASWRLYHNW